MIRSLITMAALACSALLTAPSFAAHSLAPVVVQVIASADDAVASPVAVIAPAEVRVAEPSASVERASSTSLAVAKLTKIATIATANSHRLHVDPGRRGA